MSEGLQPVCTGTNGSLSPHTGLTKAHNSAKLAPISPSTSGVMEGSHCIFHQDGGQNRSCAAEWRLAQKLKMAGGYLHSALQVMGYME